MKKLFTLFASLLVAGVSSTFGCTSRVYAFDMPSSSPSGGMIPVVSAAAESDHVLKATPGNLYNLRVTTGANAGYVLVFNATAAPADGAGQTPVLCEKIAANSTLTPPALPYALYFSTGIVVSFSTTGCFTKTADATAFFAAQVK
jgi:hypothetical protein